MSDLIEALQIFLKYKNEERPTHCEHDEMAVVGITFDEVSVEDRDKLDKLGFFWVEEVEVWVSYRFGNA